MLPWLPQLLCSPYLTEAGEAVITLDQPCLFTVDINRQMDDQDTGKLPMNRGVYEGPPIHTLTIYANAVLVNKPGLEEAGVLPVRPGEQPLEEGDWHTLLPARPARHWAGS